MDRETAQNLITEANAARGRMVPALAKASDVLAGASIANQDAQQALQAAQAGAAAAASALSEAQARVAELQQDISAAEQGADEADDAGDFYDAATALDRAKDPEGAASVRGKAEAKLLAAQQKVSQVVAKYPPQPAPVAPVA